MSQSSTVYFISDVHLGIDTVKSSAIREQMLVDWLDHVSKDASAIYIVGDLFDYWYEYHSVVPKGYFKLFATLHHIIESGIPIYYFTGNHDLWHRSYISKEVGLSIIREPMQVEIDDHTFLIAHGDGLGPGDRKYKFIKGIMTNAFLQKMYALIHPTIGLRLMKYMSKKSRQKHDAQEHSIDRHLSYCQKQLEQDPSIDYFIMGHQHFPAIEQLNDQSSYVNLGDWTHHFTYAKWDGTKVQLLNWDKA